MAEFDTTYDYDDEESVWDDGGLLAWPIQRLQFTTSGRIHGIKPASNITTPAVLRFTTGGSMLGRFGMVGEESLTFSYVAYLGGFVLGTGSTQLVFSSDAILTGATLLHGSSTLDFITDNSVINAWGWRIGTSSLVFSYKVILNGRASGTSTEFLTFTTSAKLRKSPWQGVSEIGNAVYNNIGGNANYSLLPYELEVEP